MDELTQRIAELPPERRRLLQRLLEEQAEGSRAVLVGATAAELDVYDRQLMYEPASELDGAKSATRQFYDSVSRQLDALEVGSHAYFLNFGYVADGSPEYAQVALPTDYLNKNCIKLVLELVGDTELTDRRVVDIGCGRGGTVYVLNRFYDPRTIVGVDLSSTAIGFCRRAHKSERIRFYEGDAEHLKFDDETVDVVTNVESSHSYPNVNAFYSEVARVLAPGGYFLYTDLFATARYGVQIEQLREAGLIVQLERDITPNVLQSCAETANVHRSAFEDNAGGSLMDDFLGMPGSQVHQEMVNGRSTYRILRLRKPDR